MPTPRISALPSPSGVLDRVRREVERNTLRARNGIKLVSGLSPANVGQSPKDVVWEHGRTTLYHYRGDDVRISPPLLLVFSLISRSYVLDLSPGNSFVEHLKQAGFDVYLLDWGEPDERDAANRLEDYTDDYLPAAIERVRNLSGADTISLLGYCFGGVLTLLHAAHHPSSPIRSHTVMATPVDFSQVGPMTNIMSSGLDVANLVGPDGNIAPSVMLQSFRSLTPTAEITTYVNLLEKLWNDDYVAAHQAMSTWGNDHVPFPGTVARQVADMLVRDNGMMTDRLTLGGDRVHLADVTTPFLAVLATRDHIIPEAAAEPVVELVGSTDKHLLRLNGGHIGLVVGKTAARTTIPTVIEFLQRQSEVSR
ncbi:alpha/beta fold hydrolase [Pseudonocardia sp. GCM10023141]|uniref:alpha/beta fold hydrolase n=1 Tax=Pseudonocardia sp. GCM10023141 TaxID=3252653 RepID=UPI0036127AFE